MCDLDVAGVIDNCGGPWGGSDQEDLSVRLKGRELERVEIVIEYLVIEGHKNAAAGAKRGIETPVRVEAGQRKARPVIIIIICGIRRSKNDDSPVVLHEKANRRINELIEVDHGVPSVAKRRVEGAVGVESREREIAEGGRVERPASREVLP